MPWPSFSWPRECRRPPGPALFFCTAGGACIGSGYSSVRASESQRVNRPRTSSLRVSLACVVAEDHGGDTRRLGGVFDFKTQLDGALAAAVDLFDFLDCCPHMET